MPEQLKKLVPIVGGGFLVVLAVIAVLVYENHHPQQCMDGPGSLFEVQLAPLTDGLEKTSDPASALMRRGLEMAAANADPNQVMEALEGQLEEEMKESRARHRMIIAGIETAGKGMKPDEVAEAVRNEAL